jgi:hypothetical protein
MLLQNINFYVFQNSASYFEWSDQNIVNIQIIQLKYIFKPKRDNN